MHRIHTIRQHPLEPPPLHRERVPIQPQDMLRVNCPNGLLHALVERRQPHVLRIAGLVQRIIPGHPGVAAIPGCDLLPQPDGAVLVVFILPEAGVVGWVVGVPVGVLAARGCVHVEDGVDVVVGALMPVQHAGCPGWIVRRGEETYKLNNPIQMLESLLLQNPRVHIVFEVPIVERDAQAVQPQAGVELGVRVGEEILEPLVEEELVLLLAEDAAHGGSVLRLVAGEAGDEVFHAECVSSL